MSTTNRALWGDPIPCQVRCILSSLGIPLLDSVLEEELNSNFSSFFRIYRLTFEQCINGEKFATHVTWTYARGSD
jgi:hypothetical protein